MTLPINPPGRTLGTENAILSGYGTRYHVRDFEGCLSLKSVLQGSADWETGGRRFVVDEARYLILNDRQHYTITIDSPKRVRTFCLFFERGFVEEINRVVTTGDERLLDSPQSVHRQGLEFLNRLEPQDSMVLGLLRRFQAELVDRRMPPTRWDEHFLRIGAQLVRERQETLRAILKLPAVKSSTREEVYRRLLRGRDFLLASLTSRIVLKDVARAAALSPFHFHRSFARVFRETPHQYLTRHRLERAARLLRSTETSVTEVGLAAGFESTPAFSHSFRCHYGLSPLRYRRGN
ncbi:MAG TPA: AraC family transcriptional regulator [Bryobacteraceae bacterium]|nr:AraC family transcriptional regulator [Bryobacteraceae bacterium]